MTKLEYGLSHLRSAMNWLARARVHLKFNNIETATLCLDRAISNIDWYNICQVYKLE